MTRNARGFMWFLQQRANKTGQSWWSQDKMARELQVHIRTIGRWVRELKAEGRIDSIRRGSTSNLYTLLKNGEQLTLDVRSDQTKCPNVSIELNSTEVKQAVPARKPPSVETEHTRRFAGEYRKLFEGWVEPEGRRVPGCVSMLPAPDTMPILANTARSAGLEPQQAIRSLDRKLRSARERVLGARNPNGLIIHIARELWRAS